MREGLRGLSATQGPPPAAPLSRDQVGAVVAVQSLSHVQLFATPWTAACQASLSIANSEKEIWSNYHCTVNRGYLVGEDGVGEAGLWVKDSGGKHLQVIRCLMVRVL